MSIRLITYYSCIIPISLISIHVLDREYNDLMNNYVIPSYKQNVDNGLYDNQENQMFSFKRDNEPLKTDPTLQLAKAIIWPICLPFCLCRNHELKKRM
jgi:hypothetical protein